MQDATVGLGVGASDIALDLGDLHPSGHGALRLECGIDTGGDPARIVSAEMCVERQLGMGRGGVRSRKADRKECIRSEP